MTGTEANGTIDLTLRSFFRHWWRELFGLDGRLWRTLWLALRQPGSPAKEHLAGRGGGYIHPVRFYLAVNLVFFLAVPFLNGSDITIWGFTLDSLSGMPPSSDAAVAREIERWPGGEPVYRAVFDERVGANQAVFLFMMIPMLGLPMWLFLRRRRRFLAEHLLYATAMLTFFLLTTFCFGLAALVARLGAVVGLYGRDTVSVSFLVLIVVWMGWACFGFVGSVRRFYELRRMTAVTMGIVALLTLLLGTSVYGKLLFWHTLLSLRL